MTTDANQQITRSGDQERQIGGEALYKMADGDGLHVLVTLSGSKLWRLQYRFGGKQRQNNDPQGKLKQARQPHKITVSIQIGLIEVVLKWLKLSIRLFLGK